MIISRPCVALLCVLLPLANAPKGSAASTDFKNFSYPWNRHLEFGVPMSWGWKNVKYLSGSIKVKDGEHFFKNGNGPLQRTVLSVENVIWGDLDNDGKPEAVVTLNYSTGGTANWDFLYVFRIEDGKPKLIAFLQGGSRGSGGIRRARIAAERLFVTFADPARMSGDCCSEGFVRETYQWKDSHFVRIAQVEGRFAPHHPSIAFASRKHFPANSRCALASSDAPTNSRSAPAELPAPLK